MQKNKRGQKIKAGELDKEISFLLADKRKRAGLKQEDIAKEIGLTVPSYFKYESNKNKISISILYKIFDVLGMNEKERMEFWEKVGKKHNEINK